MLTPKLQMLQRTLKRLMRREAAGALERVVTKTHAADLAFLLQDLSTAERVQLINACVEDEKRADIIGAADAHLAAEVIAALAPERAVDLLHRMEPDDVSDVLEELPAELSDRLLELMREADRREVEELSSYESATAGGIMSPRFFSLDQKITAREAIEELQKVDTELEMVFYVYVAGEEGRLDGVLSLRQLVTTKPDTKLGDLMTTDVISVTPEVDQEDVAKLASRYGLLAIPVVDSNHRMLGIVTVDDVIDVLREEATEDILRMAGAGDQLAEQQQVLRSVVSRFPWLIATGIGGALSAVLVGAYSASLLQFLPLIFFIPLVLGLAGVIGMQSATVVAQNIAHGRARTRLALGILRQAAVGLLLGLVFGSLFGAFGWLWWEPANTTVGFTILVLGAGIASAMTAAAILGSLFPLLFAQLRLDPALASGPFIAIAVDLVALLLYLSIGRSFGG